MYLAGQKKESGSLKTRKILRAFFLAALFILVFNANTYGQTANAGKHNQDKPRGRNAVGVESPPPAQSSQPAPEVVKAGDQSLLRRYVDRIKSPGPLRRKLLISSALFLLSLLLLVYAVRGLMHELRRDKEVSARAEITGHNIVSISLGPYTFFIGNCDERDPNAVQHRPKSLRPYVE